MDRHRRLADLVAGLGTVVAVFDATTQDSGNISYGVRDPSGRQWFVKTSGSTDPSPDGRTSAQRAACLRRAAAIPVRVEHPALVPLHAVVDAVDGVAVVYEWFDGELLRSPADRRDHPDEPRSRFRALPIARLLRALDEVIDLHVALERDGWVAGDFYDGSLMYDATTSTIKVIDLESYQLGPYINEVGRLAGSTRFMAPEEFCRGARITARTTVYNLGRMLDLFLPPDGPAAVAAVVAATTTADPQDRPTTVADA